jgi:hypothetical protein
MENKNTVSFDPGFSSVVMNYLGQIGYTYYMFNAINNLKIKRQNFPLISVKIEKLLKINISFYLGCLLWASCISKLDNYEIEGNQLLGEECPEEEYTSEINFLIDFLENQFPRDCKYYQNKIYKADERYLIILKAYKELLIANDGFINCSNTNQIVLPSNLKPLDENQAEEIKKHIYTSIESKNLESIFECYDAIL